MASLRDLFQIWQPPIMFAAETLLEPVIQQEHHTAIGGDLKKTYFSWCDSIATIKDLEEQIHHYNQTYGADEKNRIRYAVVNRDIRNYTAEYHGPACVGPNRSLERSVANNRDSGV